MGTDERERERPSARAGTIVTDDPTKAAGPYAIGEVIGRSGMGEVLLAHDRRIGRDVALKRLPVAAPGEDEMRRFMREARIQARLEHPAVVPVYEMGRDQSGRPFFTMKRIAGDSLTQLIGQASSQRLLRAFADVCRAIDYAHSRGVVHRDLKPSNIMLGEFGEVYVIDWGIARVLDDSPGEVELADIDTIQATPAQETVGTPGYIAPEQLHGPNVDRPADVYSLGAILFEILAGEPLHDRGAAKHSTLAGETVLSPSVRRPDRVIAPELDVLTLTMLASKPSTRPTARRCADLIEEYLDGDRDVARRRVMAHDLVAIARDAMREGREGDAMRAASRALALDPESDAAPLVSRLMLQPASVASPEAREKLLESDDEAVSTHARAATPGYVLIASFLPFIVWNGVRSWPTVLAMFGLALVMTLAAWDLSRRPRKSLAHWIVYAFGNALLVAIMTRLASPLIVVPAVVSFVTGSVVTYPAFLARKWLLISIMLAGWVVPFALELGGALPATWRLDESGFAISGDAMQLQGTPAIATVVLSAIATILMAGLQSARVGRASREAHHRLVLQSHQLRQLLPS